MARKGDSVKKQTGKIVRELLLGSAEFDQTTIRVYQYRPDHHVTEISCVRDGKRLVIYRDETTTIEWGLSYACSYMRRCYEGIEAMLASERNGTATTKAAV